MLVPQEKCPSRSYSQLSNDKKNQTKTKTKQSVRWIHSYLPLQIKKSYFSVKE